jgi:hypothetical protein
MGVDVVEGVLKIGTPICALEKDVKLPSQFPNFLENQDRYHRLHRKGAQAYSRG